MDIKLNGKPHSLPEATSLSALAASLGLNASQVAIERNRHIVPRSKHTETLLSPGDEIEIVHFIGGG